MIAFLVGSLSIILHLLHLELLLSTDDEIKRCLSFMVFGIIIQQFLISSPGKFAYLQFRGKFFYPFLCHQILCHRSISDCTFFVHLNPLFIVLINNCILLVSCCISFSSFPESLTLIQTINHPFFPYATLINGFISSSKVFFNSAIHFA